MSRVRSLLAIGVLASTIIGAGIFSLPYVMHTVGVIPGILFLLFFSVIYMCVHSMYASLLLGEEGEHEFGSVAVKYFGFHKGRIVSSLVIFELLFVLTAYLILIPDFSSLLFGMGGIAPILVFWLLGAITMMLPLIWLESVEFFGIVGIVLFVLLVVWCGFSSPTTLSLSLPQFSLYTLLLPFGPLLFALSGRPAIAGIIRAVREAKKEGIVLKPYTIIIWGTLIPGVLYVLYSVGMLMLGAGEGGGLMGGILGLPGILPQLLGGLGIIAIWTSYIMVGISARKMIVKDFHSSEFLGWSVVLIIPIAAYLLGVKNFLETVGFIGGIFLAIEGLCIVRMWVKKQDTIHARNIGILFYILFAMAIVYEIYVLFA